MGVCDLKHAKTTSKPSSEENHPKECYLDLRNTKEVHLVYPVVQRFSLAVVWLILNNSTSFLYLPVVAEIIMLAFEARTVFSSACKLWVELNVAEVQQHEGSGIVNDHEENNKHDLEAAHTACKVYSLFNGNQVTRYEPLLKGR